MSSVDESCLVQTESQKDFHGGLRHGRTAHTTSSSLLRKKSNLNLFNDLPTGFLKSFLSNIQEVLLGTTLAVFFPAIPLAVVAQLYGFEKHWIFVLSLLGLTPLAERVSFLTEQIAYYTGATVGGLLNATCGNATELIIAILALVEGKIEVVKFSLLGSILSNLLLVLGTSLFCGGIANLGKEQKFDRSQAEVNTLLLLLGLLCHALPLMFRIVATSPSLTSVSMLRLSRASSVLMLAAYSVYIIFQLVTHRRLFEPSQDPEDANAATVAPEEGAVIGIWSGVAWLVGMTAIIALLSEYVVGTIEDASESWGLSISFISIILLPIVGNAAEHAGAVIFAYKNKPDLCLSIALGSATQISLFVVPFCVIVSWILGVKMDLNFNLLETGTLAMSILVTAFALQDGTWNYLKGFVLILFYAVIGVCFFVSKAPAGHSTAL